MSDIYFSVVIPMYNRSGLITKTINSVLEQSTTESFQIIVVDDGSTDDSADVVKSIADSRIKYLYQENAGANPARNRGIDAAEGKYIAMLDSDDTFTKNHLENAARVFRESPDIVLYSKIIVDRGNERFFTKPPRSINPTEQMSEYLLCDRGFLQTSTVVLPALLAKKVKYALGLPYGQDTDFAIRLFAQGAKFKMIQEPGAIWLDIKDDGRISSKSSPLVRMAWLDSVRSIITDQAYHGDKGWFVAKSFARQGKVLTAAKYYLTAVLKGCYNPRLALVIGFQVFFPSGLYRNIANFYIGIKKP